MTFLSNVLEKAILSQLVLDLVVNALAQCFSTLVLDAPAALHILCVSLIKQTWFNSWAH